MKSILTIVAALFTSVAFAQTAAPVAKPAEAPKAEAAKPAADGQRATVAKPADTAKPAATPAKSDEKAAAKPADKPAATK
jgi:hypothetical protein